MFSKHIKGTLITVLAVVLVLINCLAVTLAVFTYQTDESITGEVVTFGDLSIDAKIKTNSGAWDTLTTNLSLNSEDFFSGSSNKYVVRIVNNSQIAVVVRFNVNLYIKYSGSSDYTLIEYIQSPEGNVKPISLDFRTTQAGDISNVVSFENRENGKYFVKDDYYYHYYWRSVGSTSDSYITINISEYFGTYINGQDISNLPVKFVIGVEAMQVTASSEWNMEF